MKIPTLFFSCLFLTSFFITGCEHAGKLIEEPFSPIAEPMKPIITPINDTVEEAVAVKKTDPFGLNTTVSIADQKQVRVAF